MDKTILKELESCKTIKSAKTLLLKKGYEIEEVRNGYGFKIDDKKYSVLKDIHGIRIVGYSKWDTGFLDRCISDKPMCFGYKMK